MLFSINSWPHWILNHPTASLFPGLCIYFCAIWGEFEAIGCHQISLNIWSTEWRAPRTHDTVQGCVCPHSTYATRHLSFPHYHPNLCQLNFLFLPPPFHCFFPILKPPNSYLPYSLRQGCKILSTLMCTLPCASDKMPKLKGPKQKPEQTVSRNQVLEQGWLQTELNTTAQAMTRTRPPSPWLGSELCAHSTFRLYVGPSHQSLRCYVQVQPEREKAFSSNPARVLKFILIELTMVDSNNRTGHGLSQDQWHFRPRNVPPRAH